MKYRLLTICSLLLLAACNSNTVSETEKSALDSSEKAENKVVTDNDSLPPPFVSESITKRSDVVGWKEGAMPAAPAEFTVTRFAAGLEHPRWIYVADNGDVFVSQG